MQGTSRGLGESSPSKEGGSSRRFCCCGCFSFPFPCPRGSGWSDDELLPDSKDLRFGGGLFLGCVGLGGGGGGHGRGFGFLGRGGGGGVAGEALRGLPGVGGLNPQLNSRISLSAHPSHPNSPSLVCQAAGALPLPQPGQDGAPPLGVERQ